MPRWLPLRISYSKSRRGFARERSDVCGPPFEAPDKRTATAIAVQTYGPSHRVRSVASYELDRKTPTTKARESDVVTIGDLMREAA